MTDNASPSDPPATSARLRLGLPSLALVGLALLATPRVVLHDLGIVSEGTALNAALVFVPPVTWIAVALWKRVPNAFVTILTVGALYGIFLALGHQILWNASFGDNPPELGGNLTDLDPGLQAVIVRSFAVVSSVVTGTVVGAIAGLVAWVISKARHSRSN